MQFEYLNAPCAAGKTFAIAEMANWLASMGFHVLIAQPHKLLINKTIKEEFSRFSAAYPIQSLHSEDTTAVVEAIVARMNAAEQGRGEILLITQQALLRLPHISARAHWIVIVDEIPNVMPSKPIPLKENYKIITDQLDLQTVRGNSSACDYALLTAKTRSSVIQEDSSHKHSLAFIATNSSKDIVHQQFQDIAHAVTSDQCDVYVSRTNFERVLAEEDDSGVLHTFWVLKPTILSGFDRVIIAGADFKESILFLHWSTYPDVTFAAVPEFVSKKLRYQEHPNGSLLDIRYLVDQPWSKKLLKKELTLQGRKTMNRPGIAGGIFV